jgi:hypothetical protein
MTPAGVPADRLDASAFRADRLDRPGTWAVAFLDDNCPFCREFGPRFSSLAGGGEYRVARADVTDYASPLWDDFRLEVVPTVVLFRNGTAFDRWDGTLGLGLSEADLERIRSALAPT